MVNARKTFALVVNVNLIILDKLARKLPNLKKLVSVDSVKKKSKAHLQTCSQLSRTYADKQIVLNK